MWGRNTANDASSGRRRSVSAVEAQFYSLQPVGSGPSLRSSSGPGSLNATISGLALLLMRASTRTTSRRRHIIDEKEESRIRTPAELRPGNVTRLIWAPRSAPFINTEEFLIDKARGGIFQINVAPLCFCPGVELQFSSLTPVSSSHTVDLNI